MPVYRHLRLGCVWVILHGVGGMAFPGGYRMPHAQARFYLAVEPRPQRWVFNLAVEPHHLERRWDNLDGDPSAVSISAKGSQEASQAIAPADYG